MGSGKPYSGRWQFCALFGLAAVCLGLPLFWNTTTNELSTESCTGPGIGHTIGDNGEVLRFTHVDGDSTSLPALLRSVWDAKAAEGVFRFSVKDLPTRHAEGPRLGWAVELLAIVGRRKPFPDPLPTYLPFDPAAFNFYKASPAEFMFAYRTAADIAAEAGAVAAEADAAKAAAEAAAGVAGMGRRRRRLGAAAVNGVENDGEAASTPAVRSLGRRLMAAAAGAIFGAASAAEMEAGRRNLWEEGGDGDLPADPDALAKEQLLRGPVSKAGGGNHGGGNGGGGNDDGPAAGGNALATAAAMTAAAVAGGQRRYDCVAVTTAAPVEHAVLVNPRPIGRYSGLLLPFAGEALPQRATAEALAVGFDFAAALGGSPELRVGFNGMGAGASVNHLHFQVWEFKDSPDGLLPLERTIMHPVATLTIPPEKGSGGDAAAADSDAPEAQGRIAVGVLTEYPVRGLVYDIVGTSAAAAGRAVGTCVDWLIRRGHHYSLLVTSAAGPAALAATLAALDGHGDGGGGALRVYLLPRQAIRPPPFASVPGFPELAGEVIVVDEGDFARLSGDDVYAAWRDLVSLKPAAFDAVAAACTGPALRQGASGVFGGDGGGGPGGGAGGGYGGSDGGGGGIVAGDDFERRQRRRGRRKRQRQRQQ